MQGCITWNVVARSLQRSHATPLTSTAKVLLARSELLLNMVSFAAAAAAPDAVAKVGLVATRLTVEAELYERALREPGIEAAEVTCNSVWTASWPTRAP